jgi:hypothetical protein
VIFDDGAPLAGTRRAMTELPPFARSCRARRGFEDKTRHHPAGTLEPDFVLPFCHPIATDGVFLAHFEVEKDEEYRINQCASAIKVPALNGAK